MVALSLKMIIGYSDVFTEKAPINPVDLVKHIPRRHLIAELAGLNNLLKSNFSWIEDSSHKTQLAILQSYFVIDPIQYNIWYSKFYNYKHIYTNQKGKTIYPIVFSRECCLVAIEYVLNSDELMETENSDDFLMRNHWNDFIKFILAVNEKLTEMKNMSVEDFSFVEELNAKFLPLAEMRIHSSPIYEPARGFKLITYLNGSEYGIELENYVQKIYGICVKDYIKQIIDLYYHKSSETDNLLNCFYLLQEKTKMHEGLSQRFKGANPMQLIAIKKSPLYFDDETNGLYKLDGGLLVSKTFSQLINDFWFDHLKGKVNSMGKSYNISNFKSKIGYFFESYVQEIIEYSIKKCNNVVSRYFDDLKLRNGTELADIYIRSNNKIILAQVKSGSIYDKEKLSGDIDELYKNNREHFFENFGVVQLFKSIQVIDHIHEVDNKYEVQSVKYIYPVLIMLDKVFQTPFMNEIFNQKFQELLSTLPPNNKRIIHKLTLLHISDLELISNVLVKKPQIIWEILKTHLKSKTITPFYQTVNIYLNKNRDNWFSKERFLSLYFESSEDNNE